MPSSSYDLTDFGSKGRFETFLRENELTHYYRLEEEIPAYTSDKEPTTHYKYVWVNPETGVKVATANNPISGKYSNPERRKDEVGYASYIAVHAPETGLLHKVLDSIEKHAEFIKDGPADGFMGINDDELEEIRRREPDNVRDHSR